jgi:haloalkane dehalogenase
MITNPPTAADDLARPGWLPVEQWPFPLRAMELDGYRLAYTDVGAGPILLLVHTGLWSFVWRDLIKQLQTSFRCITLDCPGTGLSGGADHANLAGAARAVDGLVEGLGLDELVLVVHDLGAPVALQAAGGWPHRIRGLAALNAFGWQPSGLAFRSMLALMGAAPVRSMDAWTGWLPRATSTRFGVGRHLDRPGRRAFLAGVDRQGCRSFHHYLRSAGRHDYAEIESTVARLAPIPAITVFGQRNDPLGFQPRWAERFEDLVAVEVPGGNHFPMCDDPDLVAGALARWFGDRVRPS